MRLYLVLFGNDVTFRYDALEMLVYVHKCTQVVRLVANVIDLQAHAVSHANYDVTVRDPHNELINARIASALLASISLIYKSQVLHITVTENESWMEELR